MSSRQQQLIANYNSQLSSRFHSNSMALEVLVCLLVILMLALEIVKLIKKTYEWQNEFETNLEQKYSEDTKLTIRNERLDVLDNQNENVSKRAEKVITTQ
jgi:cell division protein FtsL